MRAVTVMPVTEYLDMRDTIRAIRDGHRQVGEHLTRRMLPETGIGVGQGGGTPSTKPVSWANSRNIPAPACDTTPRPSALTLTRLDPLLRFTREVPSREVHCRPGQSVVPLQDRHFRAFHGKTYITPHETPGLEAAMGLVSSEHALLVAASEAGLQSVDAGSELADAVIELARRAQEAGAVRDDLVPDDFPRLLMILVSVHATMAPGSYGWHRYLALMLDAIAPWQTRPLPPVVPFVRPPMRIRENV